MPAIICINPALKLILSHEARHIEDMDEQQAFLKIVRSVANCTHGELIGTEIGQKSGKGSRAKRSPSPYNEFIGQCMRAGNTMKNCASRWKNERKDQV